MVVKLVRRACVLWLGPGARRTLIVLLLKSFTVLAAFCQRQPGSRVAQLAGQGADSRSVLMGRSVLNE